MSPQTNTNILEIRDGLNKLPFRNGLRQVLIGRISDRFEPLESADADDDGDDSDDAQTAQRAAIEQYLAQIRSELSKHDLELARGDSDPDELFAVQQLRRGMGVDLSWMGDAFGWASRIMAIALEMVLPVIVGTWLDARFGTRFLSLLGICVGLPLGLWHLMLLARKSKLKAFEQRADKRESRQRN